MISGSGYNITSEIKRQQALAAEIAKLQTDVSSTVKIHVASDDPVAAARVAVIRQTQTDQTTYAANVTVASGIASQVDTSLGGMETSLNRAQELMLSANTDALNDSDRAAIATELQGIADDLAAAGTGTDSSGNKLFATSGTALAIPVGRNTNVVAGENYSDVFEGIPTQSGGTGSIASILAAAIAAVRAGDKTAMTASIADVQAAGTHVTDARADAGIRAARIDSAGEKLATSKVDLADERSGLEDTDMTEAVATLQSKMTVLSAAQSILAQLNKSTLFDKIG